MLNSNEINHIIKKEPKKLIKLLMENKFSELSFDHYAFMIAISNNIYKAVKIMLDFDHINPSDNDNSALIKAIKNKNIKIIKVLIHHKKIDASANNNEAILLALENKFWDGVVALSKSPNVNYKLQDTHLTLHQAINIDFEELLETRNIEAIKLLLNNPQTNIMILIKQSIVYNLYDLLIFLIEECKANISNFGRSLVQYAAESGNIRIIDYLLNRKEINQADVINNALLYSSKNNHIELFTKLKSYQFANVSFNENAILYSALLNNYSKITQLIITDPSFIIIEKNSLFLSALASTGDLDNIKLLLQFPEIKPEYDCSKAIMAAFYNDQQDVLNFFWKINNVKTELKKHNPKLYQEILFEQTAISIESF